MSALGWVVVVFTLTVAANVTVLAWTLWEDRKVARLERHIQEALAVTKHPAHRRIGPPEEWL